LQKCISALSLCANVSAKASPDHARGESHRVATTIEGAQQGETLHTARCEQCKFLRDRSAQRMSDHVRLAPTNGVHECERVFGHCWNGNRYTPRLAACDAAALGGGGGGADLGGLWNLLNQARDSILPEHRGNPSPWTSPSSMSELFARMRAAEMAVPSSQQADSFTSNRSTWTSECDNASAQTAGNFVRLLKAFEQGISGSAQGAWDRSGWLSRCNAVEAGASSAPAINYSNFCHPHPLVNTTHSSTVRCDVCMTQKNPTWRCVQCNYDECVECFPRTRSQAGSASTGPDFNSFCHSHPLIRTDHSGSRTCDVCRTSSSTTYMCSACNYDECPNCFPRTRSQAGSAPAPAGGDKGAGAPAAGGADKGSAPAAIAGSDK